MIRTYKQMYDFHRKELAKVFGCAEEPRNDYHIFKPDIAHIYAEVADGEIELDSDILDSAGRDYEDA